MTHGSILTIPALTLVVAGAISCGHAPPGDAEQTYDVIISGGRIVDGTGNPWFFGEVGIRGQRIAAVGDLSRASAHRRIDARGKIVAPGFINLTAQTDWHILVDPRLPSKVTQGITTIVSGEGTSVAPIDPERPGRRTALIESYGVLVDWTTLGEFFDRVEAAPPTLNFGTFVGLGMLREIVVGFEDRHATPAELQRMEQLVAQAMEDGALGVSTSLMYIPARFAVTEELIALSRVAARYGGIYATHQRSEGDGIDASLDEVFRIGSEADLPVHILHLKLAGQHNWGNMGRILARIDSARAAGLQVTADVYPYPYASTWLSAMLPPWVQEGTPEQMRARLRDPEARRRIRHELSVPSQEWENEFLGAGGGEGFIITSARPDSLAYLGGQRISEIARDRGIDSRDAMMDIVLAGDARFISFIMDENEVAQVMAHPWTAFGTDSPAAATDGPLATPDLTHPRAYGSYPRVFGRYVREQGLLTLEEAVRKSTSLPAQIVGLRDRGLLREEFLADIVVFDPHTIIDVSTYMDPHRYSTGITYVLVNGQVVLEEGSVTSARPGQVVRGRGAKQ